jgi:dolichol-phosphate mannosyltransferase
MSKLVSVAVPVLNEAECLPVFHERLRAALRGLPCQFEFLFVNDGSEDESQEILERLHREDPRVRVISLSRNFGHQSALLAGIEHARGQAIVMLDADLQHPPECIPALLDQWQKGYQIVNTRRREASHTPWLKRKASRLFYRLFSFLSGVQLEPGMADFRLVDQQVAEQIRRMPEGLTFLRGIFPWLGFRQAVVTYDPAPRLAGQTKYSLGRMLRFAVAGITSFSVVPLRLGLGLGLVTTMGAVIYAVYAVLAKILTGQTVPGWTSVVALLSLFFGVQFILLGILGEYIGSIFQEVKRRPRYVISRRIGFE